MALNQILNCIFLSVKQALLICLPCPQCCMRPQRARSAALGTKEETRRHQEGLTVQGRKNFLAMEGACDTQKWTIGRQQPFRGGLSGLVSALIRFSSLNRDALGGTSSSSHMHAWMVWQWEDLNMQAPREAKKVTKGYTLTKAAPRSLASSGGTYLSCESGLVSSPHAWAWDSLSSLLCCQSRQGQVWPKCPQTLLPKKGTD